MKNTEQWLKSELKKNLEIIKELNKESDKEKSIRGGYGEKRDNRHN